MARQANPAEVLKSDTAAANAFAIKAGKERARTVLERAQTDLTKRLEQATGLRGPGVDSFTAAQLQTTLAQVREVLRPLQVGLGHIILDTGDEAAVTAAEATARYMRAADERYRGTGTQPLAIDEASMVDEATSGARASILRRIASDPDHPGHRGVLERYGTGVIGHFENELQQRFLTKAPWDSVRDKLIEGSPFLKAAPAYWAERILRTETMGATNRANWESIRTADQTFGDMCKILSCTFDDRTGADSIAVHGQIRRPEEAFESWFGAFQHPPDRPNDRAVVVPHRIAWEIPAELTPHDDGEILEAWEREGRKGSPPDRPLMTTIDLSLFGKPPVVDEELGGATASPEEEPLPIPLEEAPEPEAELEPQPFVLPEEPEPELITPPTRSLIDELDDVNPRFANDAGTVTPLNSFNEHTIESYERLKDAHETEIRNASFASPLTPKNFDRELYEQTLKKALGEYGDISKLAFARGEVAQLSAAAIKTNVHAPETIDKKIVAEHIVSGGSAARNPSTTEETQRALPLLVRSQGQTFVVAGGELIVADRFLGRIGERPLDCRVLELDKCMPPVPLTPETQLALAQKAIGAIRNVAEGGASAADQAVVRKALRDILASHGIETRDDRRGRRLFEFSLTPNPEMDRIMSMDYGEDKNTRARHYWDGAVEVRTDVMREASEGMETLADKWSMDRLKTKTPAEVHELLDGVHTLLHEEIHGASDARMFAYRGVGIAIEECATEILARKVTRDLAGLTLTSENAGKTAFPLPHLEPDGRYHHSGGFGHSYDWFITKLFDHTAELVGHEGIHQKIEGALLKMRQWTAGRVDSSEIGGKGWSAGAEQVASYGRALGLDEAKVQHLVKALTTDTQFNPKD